MSTTIGLITTGPRSVQDYLDDLDTFLGVLPQGQVERIHTLRVAGYTMEQRALIHACIADRDSQQKRQAVAEMLYRRFA